MIIAFQPGGSVKDARVVLKPDELIPVRYNNEESIVYRENPEDPRAWLLVKPKFTVLPSDSPLLSQPNLPETDKFSLTTEGDYDTTYEHADIIKIDESDGDDDSPDAASDSPVVP
jgi:hypothetical protein